jgi:hypothetical protein
MHVIESNRQQEHLTVKINAMKAEKNIGIWIDSKEATIIELAGTKIITKTVRSGLTPKPRFEGEASRKTTRASIGFDYESSQKAHYENELSKFLKIISKEVKDADQLYIFGPAETGMKLEKTLIHEIKNPHIMGVEPCDKISTPQKIARVKKFFAAM